MLKRAYHCSHRYSNCSTWNNSSSEDRSEVHLDYAESRELSTERSVVQIKHNIMQTVKENIRMVEDFPEKGVVFVDLTTIFKKPECMKKIEDALYETYKNSGATKVIGIESRGFFFSTILANRIGAGFVPLRKKGKLPAETLEVSYQKEYGLDTIQIHKDALTEDDIVILHDDILATGGTIKAAIELIKKFNVKKIYVSFIGEIDFLKGRDKIENDVDVDVLIHF